MHVKAFTPSAHVPPFWHGLGAQSSIFTSQVLPEYPEAHAHANAFKVGVEQVAPFKHGLAAHSSMSEHAPPPEEGHV